MNGFAHPWLLWSLAGLGVPLVIHLLSRKQADIIYAGSLRHLNVSFSRQFKSIRLNEILLLLLRMAMILILCLLISGWTWNDISTEKKWVLYEPGTEYDPSLKSISDSLLLKGYEAHLLTTGFPLLSKQPKEVAQRNGYWDLAASLQQQSIQDAIVFYRDRPNNFIGHRIAMPPHQHWIVVGKNSTTSFPVRAVRTGDSLVVRKGNSGSLRTSFATEVLPSNPTQEFYRIASSGDSVKITSLQAITVNFITDKGFEYDETILRNALQTIAKNSAVKIRIGNAEQASRDAWTIWLSDRPGASEDSMPSIVFRPRANAALLKQVGSLKWELTAHLSVASALEENFTLELARILQPEKEFDSILRTHDARQLSSMMWSNDLESILGLPAESADSSAASTILALLFLALLLAERIVAWKRNQ